MKTEFIPFGLNHWPRGSTACPSVLFARSAVLGRLAPLFLLSALIGLLPGSSPPCALAQAPPTYYVDAASANPVAPYTNWATAAQTIQQAIDAGTASGRVVLVTNGVYRSGGLYYGGWSRIMLTKGVAVRSVNGPNVTVIEGAPPTGDGTNEDGRRCAYLGANTVLHGFTLTRGNSVSAGGGAYCEPGAVLTNCVLTANSAGSHGGGAYQGTLYNCTLTENSAYYYGGGACGGTLYNCTLSGNAATDHGGGASHGTLYNCTLTRNSASEGGGAYQSALFNCTLTWNSAELRGGGVAQGTLRNCLVYFNQAGRDQNCSGWNFEYCCTTPLPPGPGNIADAPQLASETHLSGNSPCLGAGKPAYASGVDIDGEPWADPPAIGADQVWPGQSLGPLTLHVDAQFTWFPRDFSAPFRADITGRPTASVWDFGDGTVVTNQPYIQHAWTVPGQYTLRLTAYNDAHPAGVSSILAVQVIDRVQYVNAACPSPVFPYTNWATAARTIQDAINAVPGARLVLVTNGVYRSGAGYKQGWNRIAVTNALTLRSVSGPGVTVIEGAPTTEPGRDNACRCAYVAAGAVLDGFTLTKGNRNTQYNNAGGGAYCEPGAVLTNCVLTANSAGSDGGGAYQGTLYNCTLIANTAAGGGGGAFGATLTNCTLSGNSAVEGGGAYQGTFYNCTLIANTAAGGGGGAFKGTLKNCTLTGNSASSGGGTWYSSLWNCTLTGNSASGSGGGAYSGTLRNCTLTGNSASGSGGGADGCMLCNCLVYFNQAPSGANWSGCDVAHCCTTPLPGGGGNGNIDADPQLASATHLSANSPCLGAGSRDASGVDIDGEAWADPPAIGADEVWPGQSAGPLTVQIAADFSQFGVGFPAPFSADIAGRVSHSVWDFGDGTVVTNQPYVAHAWTAPGRYHVRLAGYNDSHPEGVSASVEVEVIDGAFYYVDAANATPVFPYTSWATAATTIQDAVNAGTILGRAVLVAAGVYRTGSVEADGPTRLALTNVIVRSVNGPLSTVIDGRANARCVRLGANAVLDGFTLRNGKAERGGGISALNSAVVSHCILTNNFASTGGGAFGGTLDNCTLDGNSATGDGGGAHSSTLQECRLTGNSAGSNGGGAYGGAIENCTLSDNRAAGNGGGACGGSLNNCALDGNSSGGCGGGVSDCSLRNCTLAANSSSSGGGASGGTLYNSTLTGNSASGSGGGASGGTLYNCTVTGNTASNGGGGAFGGALYNCLVYFNQAPSGANWSGCTFAYSCTTPLPEGPGNIEADPQLASATHLLPTTPCLGAGSPAYASGVDIDGEPWASPPAIGADQVWPGLSSGPLSVSILVPFTQFARGFTVAFTACNTGHITRTVWDFGDGTVLTNQPCISHAWTAPGTYTVRLTGYNESHSEGVTTSVEVEVIDAVHYVDASNSTPVFPYTSWATAATNIQDAVDAGSVIGRLVLVTNGVYELGAISAWRFVLEEVVDLPSLASKLNHPARAVDRWLLERLSPATEQALELYEGATSDPSPLQASLVLDLNEVLNGPAIYDSDRLEGVELRWYIPDLLAQNPRGDDLVHLNRILLEDAYPRELAPKQVGPAGLDRVFLSDTVALRSVNGPEVTVIEGAQRNPETGAGTDVRCVYVGDNAVLSGFTLRNGGAGNGGGVLCAASGVVTNCVMTGNAADTGGGACSGTLYNCTLTGNTASGDGGGAAEATLYDCILDDNYAAGGGGSLWEVGGGGGAFQSTLYNCTLSGNSADSGGGASGSTLRNCTLTGNSASDIGGGALGSRLYNCTVTGNTANAAGGGVAGESGSWGMGGRWAPSTLYNCLVYSNQAPFGTNWAGLYINGDYGGTRTYSYSHCTFEHSCTTPLPEGPGNIEADPQLASATHLLPTSPCLGAGNAAYATGVDIDGEPWASAPAIGADQLWPGQFTVPLSVRILVPFTRLVPGLAVALTADNTGPIVGIVWDFGDGTVVTNQPFVSHLWTAPRTYTVLLTGYNESHPEGVTTSVEVEVIDAVHYVDASNPAPVFPYTSWATAGTNIQDAVDAGSVIGYLVLVTNGVYRTGTVDRDGLNRVALTNLVVLRSVNGPEVTVIEGAQQNPETGAGNDVRCAYVGDHSVLSGFTLRNGGAENGGGVLCAAFGVVTNCVLTDNSAASGGAAYGGTLYNCTVSGNSAGWGGGASGGTLYNCTLTGNLAWDGGGGAYGGALYNCTLTGNGAYCGGGAYGGTLYNCLVYHNQAQAAECANWCDSSFEYSCTTPLPEGLGNIDADPRFVDAAAGDYRLRYGSPCIDAGLPQTSTAQDLAGLPRPLDGNGDGRALPDMGAYEFDLRTAVPPDWLAEHGLDATDPHVLSYDSDGDAQTSFQEWLTGNDPTDPLSFFRIEGVDAGPPVTVSYRSLTGRVYTLYAAPDLDIEPGGSILWAPLSGQVGVPGTGGLDTLTDMNALPRRFYRVGLELP